MKYLVFLRGQKPAEVECDSMSIDGPWIVFSIKGEAGHRVLFSSAEVHSVQPAPPPLEPLPADAVARVAEQIRSARCWLDDAEHYRWKRREHLRIGLKTLDGAVCVLNELLKPRP